MAKEISYPICIYGKEILLASLLNKKSIFFSNLLLIYLQSAFNI